jgi:hypothetical protein
MKRKVLNVMFALAMLLPAGTGFLRADSLYVYVNGEKQAYELGTVEKLTLSSEGLVVDLTGATPDVTVLYADLQSFSLKDYADMPTSVASTKTVEVDVYPNPVTDKVTVVGASGLAAVNLLDLQGRAILKITPTGDEISFSLSPYPAGIYFVQIIGENGIEVKKIIKK